MCRPRISRSCFVKDRTSATLSAIMGAKRSHAYVYIAKYIRNQNITEILNNSQHYLYTERLFPYIFVSALAGGIAISHLTVGSAHARMESHIIEPARLCARAQRTLGKLRLLLGDIEPARLCGHYDSPFLTRDISLNI